jgi:hypothetical protein
MLKRVGLTAGIVVSLAAGLSAPAGAAPKNQAPQVTTGAASALGQTTATVQGTVNPRGQATTYRFDYGKTTAYGLMTTARSAGMGSVSQTVSAALTSLAPGTTYHYRIVAASSGGVATGKDKQFKTLPRLTILARPNRIVFGGATVLSGQLQSEDNVGKTIQLQADSYPYGSWAPVTTTTTKTGGGYSFRRAPALNTRYRVVTTKAPIATSSTATVGVRFRLSLGASDTTPAKGHSVRFSGYACPAHVGGLVSLQRRSSTGRWSTVARTRLVAASPARGCPTRSRYSRSIRVYGSATYRTVAAHDASHLDGIARALAVRVH